jgi:hypothetical protein
MRPRRQNSSNSPGRIPSCHHSHICRHRWILFGITPRTEGIDIHRNAEGLVLPTHKDPPDGTYIAIVSAPAITFFGRCLTKGTVPVGFSYQLPMEFETHLN